MPHLVGPEEGRFFRHNEHVEFEDLITKEQAAALHQELTSRLSNRSPERMWSEGHDLFRESPLVKKTALSRAIADVAFQLTDQKPLRIAFDQAIVTDEFLTPLPNAPLDTLESLSSICPIVAGVLIDLNPDRAGHALFFQPGYPLNLKERLAQPNQCFLLIAYAPEKALYYQRDTDLHTHRLKHLGYVYGDALKEPHHPIVFK